MLRNKALLALAAGLCLVSLGGYVMPRRGDCTSRRISFWKTNIRATELRGNLYMLSVYGTDLINANTTALVGREGVLLVDPGHPEMLRKERNALPGGGDSRVRIVINSHAHPDHACANSKLFDQGAIVVGHGSIEKYLVESKVLRRKGDAPQVTYDRELTLPFDGQQVRLIHPRSAAHTDGDTLTIFPRENVISAGDLFVAGSFPFMGYGSSIDGYIAAQEQLLKLANKDTLIVPGHGPVARRADVEASVMRMREVRRRITALHKEGLSKEEVLARHPLDDLNPGRTRSVTSGQALAESVYDSIVQTSAKNMQMAGDSRSGRAAAGHSLRR